SPGSNRPAGISQTYPSAAWRNCRSSSTRGSAESGGSSSGTMALAPGWRTISSCPWEPSGNLTVSTSRLITRPRYFRSEEIKLIQGNMGRVSGPHKGLEHRSEPDYRDFGGFGEEIGEFAAE